MKNFKFLKANQEFTYDDLLANEAIVFANYYMTSNCGSNYRLRSVIGEFGVVEKRFNRGILSSVVIELKPTDRNMVILYSISSVIDNPHITNIEVIDFDEF